MAPLSGCNSRESAIDYFSKKPIWGSSIHSFIQCLLPAGRGQRRTQALSPGIPGWGPCAVGSWSRGSRRRGGVRERAAPPRRMLTSGCLRRMCLLMEALVDTLVPHNWQLCASTLSWVSCTCFCSMYSVTYFLSHTEHVHCLPTARAHGEGETGVGGEAGSL